MELSNRLLKFYNKKSVFRDKDVLKKGHHPKSLDEVIHRDEIIDKLLTYLQEAIHGKVPDNVFIYGTFGTGKTMLTKLITSEIKIAAKQTGNDLITIYVYCETLCSTSPLMQYINQSIINNLHETNKLVGITKAKNFEYFYELVDQAKNPIMIIFDEIDKLKEPDIINQFSRIKECGFTKNNVCIIGITNDTNFYSNLDGRTKSIIGQNELFIPPYDAFQLNDILKFRSEKAFVPNALEDIVIPFCGAIGAQENGDARTAIDLLRIAGDNADQRGSLLVQECDAIAAKSGLELNRQLELAGGLPRQTKAVLLSCVQNYNKKMEAIETNDIYYSYVKICNFIGLEPVKLRRVNDYIGELNTLGLVSVKKVSRGRKKGVFNAIVPLVDVVALEQLILQEEGFEDMKRRC